MGIASKYLRKQYRAGAGRFAARAGKGVGGRATVAARAAMKPQPSGTLPSVGAERICKANGWEL